MRMTEKNITFRSGTSNWEWQAGPPGRDPRLPRRSHREPGSRLPADPDAGIQALDHRGWC